MAAKRRKKGKRSCSGDEPPPSAERPAALWQRSRGWDWAFRIIAAIVAPTLFFLLLEGGLRLFGYGHSSSFTATEEVRGQPCRVPNPTFGWRFFPREISRQALWFSYPVEKPADTVRIFVLGGSAAQGDPEPAYGVARVLSTMLHHRYPGTRFEVVNAAMTAINSHVVRDIAAEVVDHDPDLLVVYLGNNEVVGPFGASNSMIPLGDNLAVIRTSLFVKGTRLGQLAHSLAAGRDESVKWRGMEMFLENTVRHDDQRLQSVYRHFRSNLDAILADAGKAGVPVLLSTVGVNLRDCAPFGSLHKPGLPADTLAEWSKHYETGTARRNEGQLEAAVSALRSAESLDDDYAELHYQLGHCHLTSGDSAEARRCFERARDLDTLRFRADSTINDAIRQAAVQAGNAVSLVDTAELFDTPNSPQGIPGEESFFEHVHLTFHGNYLLARALLGQAESRLRARLGEPRGPLASEEACRERLALTDFDRLVVLQLVQGRLEMPPFTAQLDIDTHLARRTRQADQLGKQLMEGAFDKEKTLYQKALAGSPDDEWLQFRHGFFLLNGSGDHAGAEKAFQAALHGGLRSAELWLGMGMARYHQGRLDAAIAAFRKGLEIQPRQWRILSQLGFTLNLRGKADEAVASCARAVEIAPDNSEVHANLGLVLLSQGKMQRAMESFEESIEIGGESAPRLVNLGLARAGLGMKSKAVECHIKALELNPADFRANREMGQLRLQARDFAAARRHFSRAHQARPNDIACANNLAWLLATSPASEMRDGQRALELALRICQATGNSDPSTLDTLAAAQAEAGQFDRAVATATKALERTSDPAAAAQVQARLRLYQDGRAFRESR